MEIKNTKIGFIGLGVMGKSMAENLRKSGAEMHVFTRTKTSADEIVSKGAVWHDSPADVAKNSDVVFTIVGYPADVEQVYLGENGLIKNSKKGTILVDMTTSSPSLAVELYKTAKEQEVQVLDAPVSGGDIGAQNATLTIMCGGEQETFDAVLPFFECMGKTFTLMGEAGAGQHTKAANQILVAANLIGAIEAIRYAESSDLDPQKMIEALSGGAAASWQLSNNGKKVIDRDFAPGFFVKHFLKDLNIALKAAEEVDLNLPMLELAQSCFHAMCDKGFSDAGTQALYEYYKRYL
ncbi:NAD(P)-dependent oxidoreductase [Treponema phagedenis]|uniref:NAD(P)-dependent oxidoreductase n=1 Tax=Treponema phagedenis TaxID=162 RepID=A0A0B7GUF0_TREPH|nr:NAD(P)-dependent oxidoreductase [Treponema phagedenis]NVP24231.1 NAD(P)-dependent oxidoreductase [Treponema phagedenis]QEJ94206.1 NAD(P)-dependent oxidoreductase [Treponema phagedenis]QEJ99209.1 NAD(P)-dependent oxidoreductase [Treponema phagedenis]QEK00165.1 NAD(P)-dependent oxidoreductase [Treponema phagedenis]QEK07659.1 NAD(P)-dependent oxidoreductase [Treponema phagedenis]